MWFEPQNCAMMGVQVTAGKRKLETAATAGGDICPAKTGRWEPPAGGGGGAAGGTGPTDDCIARLQAVAVPVDTWRPTPTPTPAPTATLLSPDDFDDDDDFEDELSDDDRCSGAPPMADPLRYHQHQSALTAYDYQHTGPHQQHSARYGPAHNSWHYYAPPQQQTIRCEENGKSYLELGAAPPAPPPQPTRARCCDGRTRWCNVPCYRQRRLAVLNLSMCKLARYRQCSDPSLRRSVLICNTLRHIEREMEAEGQQASCPPPPPEPPCYSPSAAFTECTPLTPVSTAQSQRLSPVQPVQQPLDPYEHNLREFTSPSGRATPFPSANTDADSGIGDEDQRTINWGSVLSLTSQTDLEPLNNNELYAELGLTPAPADDWKEPQRMDATGEWDTFMHVLVGGS